MKSRGMMGMGIIGIYTEYIHHVIQSGPLHPLVGGHLTIYKGRLTIPKRLQRIAR